MTKLSPGVKRWPGKWGALQNECHDMTALQKTVPVNDRHFQRSARWVMYSDIHRGLRTVERKPAPPG